MQTFPCGKSFKDAMFIYLKSTLHCMQERCRGSKFRQRRLNSESNRLSTSCMAPLNDLSMVPLHTRVCRRARSALWPRTSPSVLQLSSLLAALFLSKLTYESLRPGLAVDIQQSHLLSQGPASTAGRCMCVINVAEGMKVAYLGWGEGGED